MTKVSGGGSAGSLGWNPTCTHLHMGGHHKVSVPSNICFQNILCFSDINCCIELISFKFCEMFILMPAYLYLIKQANVEVSGSRICQ